MATGRARARPILKGELENVGLATLLTILDIERRSGKLVLERGRMLGRLFVRDGRVLRAETIGRGRTPDGPAAVYEMLRWTEGTFELWQAEVGGEDEVGQSTTFLLIEGARRADESVQPSL